ncbi:MAG: hypothetical protein GF308_22275 [Candidatus Heimdallarchaeota archaeon]|nr:hypothetical protein [Candidatus Heimdallarchaeota archaeon]
MKKKWRKLTERYGRIAFSFLIGGLIIGILVLPIVGVLGKLPHFTELLSKNIWLGILVSIIIEIILVYLFNRVAVPLITWRFRQLRYRFVKVDIETTTKFGLPKKKVESDFVPIAQRIISNAFQIKHSEEKSPSDYWVQIYFGKNKEKYELAVSCAPNDRREFSRIQLTISAVTTCNKLSNSLITIKEIIKQFHESCYNEYDFYLRQENIIFQVKPINRVLINNYWFNQISKEQALKITIDEDNEIFLYEDYAILSVKEFSGHVAEFLRNIIISSYGESTNQ